MGWTYVQTDETPKVFLDREFKGWEGKEYVTKNIVSGIKKGCYFAAMETTPKFGVIGRKKEVWCLICLYSSNNNKHLAGREVGYKDMEETCGPFEIDVPDKVWKYLEDNKEFAPDTQCAVDWRNRVREYKEKGSKLVLKVGDIIRFKDELNFSGIKENTFRIIELGRRKVFSSYHHGFLCRLRRDTLKYQPYEIVDEDSLYQAC